MSKKIRVSYLLNALGVALVFGVLSLLFSAGVFGTSTTYIQGICTTACYTIIMVASLNLVVGISGELSLGHAGFWREAWLPASWACWWASRLCVCGATTWPS